MQSKRVVSSALERLLAGARPRSISTSSSPPISSHDRVRAASSSSSTTSRPLDVALDERSRCSPNASSSAPSSTRLLEERDGAGAQRVAAGRPSPETMWTGMCRVAGWRLRWSSTVQPVHHRQRQVEEDRVRPVLVREREAARRRASATTPLKPRSRATPSSVVGEVGVVLDDQHDAVARLDLVAVVRRPRPGREQRLGRRDGSTASRSPVELAAERRRLRRGSTSRAARSARRLRRRIGPGR